MDSSHRSKDDIASEQQQQQQQQQQNPIFHMATASASASASGSVKQSSAATVIQMVPNINTAAYGNYQNMPPSTGSQVVGAGSHNMQYNSQQQQVYGFGAYSPPQQFSQQQYIHDYIQRNGGEGTNTNLQMPFAGVQYQQPMPMPMHIQGVHGVVAPTPFGIPPPPNVLPRRRNEWASPICSCNCELDPHICWWSTWCCWLVGARTTESFDLGSSSKSIAFFWIFIILLLLVSLMNTIGGIVVAIVGGCSLAFFRAMIRQQIRDKVGIQGDFCDDYMVSCCCSCCATCQEASEGKFMNVKRIEFCCGEDLSTIESSHRQVSNNLNSPENPVGSCCEHASVISKTSKLILILCGIVALVAIIACFALGKPMNVVVLLLIFIQPFLIIYFVYWRPRRQHATLDSVIKIFAVGFWLTVFQAISLEIVLQFTISLLMYPFMKNIPALPMDTGDYSGSSNNSSTILKISTFNDNSNGLSFNGGYIDYNNGFPSGGFSIKSYIKKFIFDCLNSMFNLETKLSWNDPYFPDVTSSNFPVAVAEASADSAADPDTMKKYFGIIAFNLFLNAFVVAAGVEETMKHFAYRCCRFPQEKIENPHAILVYLMVGAIGFATAENIEYVFSSGSFINQIFVLIMRILMPVHVICSVMQAANTSKSAMGIQEMGTFRAILPAILLHGLFDYVLFLLPYIQYIYQVDELTIVIAMMCVVVSIVIFGICYACYAFGQVKKIFDSNVTEASANHNGAIYTTVDTGTGTGNTSSAHGNADNDIVTIPLTNNLP